MTRKKTIESEMHEFLELWDFKQLSNFLRDIIPLFELYDVQDENDWIKDYVKEEDKRNVLLIRTLYLVSIIAENHSGKLAATRSRYPNFYKRLEKIVLESPLEN